METTMKPLSLKIHSGYLLLCVLFVWDVVDSRATATPQMNPTLPEINSTEEAISPTTPQPAPPEAENLTAITQTETSITLQWSKVEHIHNYILLYNEEEINIPASDSPVVTQTITNLISGTEYQFTLFTVLGDIRSAGVNITAVTAPRNAANFVSTARNETSITLEWSKVEDIRDYILLYNEEEINIPASDSPVVTQTITNLRSGTEYQFTLFTVLGDVRSAGVNITAVTAPRNAANFVSTARNETSITLEWSKVEDIRDYMLLYNEEEMNISASEGQEPVRHTISGLTSGTRYEFSLFTLFENVKSRGVQHTAATAPRNVQHIVSIGQNETSITLQWEKVDPVLDYSVLFNGKEINVSTSANLVTYTISGLTSGTRYEFSLFALFENVRSSGVQHTAATAPRNVQHIVSKGQNETSITLQWEKVDPVLDYSVLFNGKEINVSTSANLVTYTISGLTSGTRYEFSLFALFENVRSSGVQHTAATAPQNVQHVVSIGQNETSITLQWEKVDPVLDYSVLFNGKEINVSTSANLVTYTISGLTSGTRYEFSLFALFENVRSSGVQHTAATAPRNVQHVVSIGQNETSITLQWEKVDPVLDYSVLFNGKEINVSTSANLVTYTISGLTSGTRYEFSLFALFENVRSSGVQHTAATAPRNVQHVVSIGQNETSITLQWEKVDPVLDYSVLFNGKEINVSTSANLVTYTISGLTSGTRYEFSLFALFENVRSSGVQHTAATEPSMVALVNVTERSATTITLAWNVDVEKDWSYFLQMNGENVQFPAEKSQNVILKSFTSLQPGTEYLFSVTTKFFGLNSTVYKDFTVTAIDCASVAWQVTSESIQGMVDGLFSNATATNKSETHISPPGRNVSFTGLYPGATYELFLEYEHKKKTFNQCSHSLTIIPSDISARCEYCAAGYSICITWDRPEGVWTEVQVNVTGGMHRVTENEQQHITIPGFLPARTYDVSVALLSDTRRSSRPHVFSCQTDPSGVIAGAVCGVLLFAVLVFLVIFIFLKKPNIISRKKPFIGGSKLSHKKYKAIPLARFPDHFYQLSMDDNRGFKQEYESLLPVGMEQTQNHASLPENKTKNRFMNVFPYDWCRVKLSTSNPKQASDYINASYMPGYNSNREYIATQGPLPSTVNDFWRMVWEQSVRGIVMVTNCIEGGKTKCEQYWPADSQPCPYGELTITTRSEQQEPNWTMREFRLKHNDTSEMRTVKHFHFTAWPDHGVPRGTEVLIQFRELVRHHIEREGTGAPTVVHCSAGVGRTGTIITLDVLLQQLERERAVGINSFVHKMRLSRPYMVQTESQYIFLHQCITDCLQAHEKNEENIYENAEMIYANATALREFHKNA